ncbi:MAG: alpha/beta fold hydrolase [Anaerolineaceae bacterium]|nr:alpha/beta fold hydrolase [Anaerolineaceae bacterium]
METFQPGLQNKKNPKRQQGIIFMVFNSLIGGMFGATIGYYLSHLELSILIGILIGFLIAALLELIMSPLSSSHWLYRRRILLLVFLEIPLAIFILGPLAYVAVMTQSIQHTICCETPLDYGANEYEDVLIQTNDGITLSGWYVPPSNNSGEVIVLLHGARGDRRGTSWFARQFIQAGYGLLLYDQRALGESTGEKSYMGWKEGEDLLAVVKYLDEREEVDAEKIGAVGLSGGGHIALNAAYLAPEMFSALWVDGVQVQSVKDIPSAENTSERFIIIINDFPAKTLF